MNYLTSICRQSFSTYRSFFTSYQSLNLPTPLHIAVKGKKFFRVRELLHKGAKVNIEGANGETPLFAAVRSGSFKMVDLLMRHGANPTLYEKQGITAFHLGIQLKHFKVTQLFIEKWGVPPNQPVHLTSTAAIDFAFQDQKSIYNSFKHDEAERITTLLLRNLMNSVLPSPLPLSYRIYVLAPLGVKYNLLDMWEFLSEKEKMEHALSIEEPATARQAFYRGLALCRVYGNQYLGDVISNFEKAAILSGKSKILKEIKKPKHQDLLTLSEKQRLLLLSVSKGMTSAAQLLLFEIESLDPSFKNLVIYAATNSKDYIYLNFPEAHYNLDHLLIDKAISSEDSIWSAVLREILNAQELTSAAELLDRAKNCEMDKKGFGTRCFSAVAELIYLKMIYKTHPQETEAYCRLFELWWNTGDYKIEIVKPILEQWIKAYSS